MCTRTRAHARHTASAKATTEQPRRCRDRSAWSGAWSRSDLVSALAQQGENETWKRLPSLSLRSLRCVGYHALVGSKNRSGTLRERMLSLRHVHRRTSLMKGGTLFVGATRDRLHSADTFLSSSEQVNKRADAKDSPPLTPRLGFRDEEHDDVISFPSLCFL